MSKNYDLFNFNIWQYFMKLIAHLFSLMILFMFWCNMHIKYFTFYFKTFKILNKIFTIINIFIYKYIFQRCFVFKIQIILLFI